MVVILITKTLYTAMAMASPSFWCSEIGPCDPDRVGPSRNEFDSHNLLVINHKHFSEYRHLHLMRGRWSWAL
jgi:hypothetical protein